MHKITMLILAMILSISLAVSVNAETVKTRIGKLKFSHDFENGYPTDKTVKKLYDEIDFQRACQLYLWGLPLVSCAQ